MHLSALTFGTLLSSQESDAHRASDFRLKLRGNSPYFTVSLSAGQIGLFDPVSLRDSVSETRRGVFRLPRPSGSCWRAGRFRVPRLAPTRRTLLTFMVRMQIGVLDCCPRLPAPVLDAGDPVPREAVLVPLVTSLTGVSTSDTSIMPYPHKSFSCGR